MAVPKKKRSRQMVSIRRSNSLSKLLNKYSIVKKNSRLAYIWNLNSSPRKFLGCDFSDINCAYYKGSKSKKVCLDCYSVHFRSSFSPYINKK